MIQNVLKHIFVHCLLFLHTLIHLEKLVLIHIEIKDISQSESSSGQIYEQAENDLDQLQHGATAKHLKSVTQAMVQIADFEQWCHEAIEILSQNKKGARKKMGASIFVISEIAKIWRKHGVKPTLRWDDIKSTTYGPFLDFVEWALFPIIPKKGSLESPVRKALGYGKK